MRKGIQATPDNTRKSRITIHPGIMKDWNGDTPKMMNIKFGSHSVPAEVTISREQQPDQVRISKDVLGKLALPLSCHFEIIVKDNTIHLGPLIGLLAGRHQESVKKRLKKLKDYVFHYPEMNGVIVAFSLEKIDTTSHKVEGFLFNPQSNEWEEGVFPYPSSIFIATGTISTKWIKHFQSVIGKGIFNNFYYDKWQIHEILDSSPILSKYLPKSILFKTSKDIYSFLKKHPSIIVKSINASRGSSIFQFEVNGDLLKISYPKTGEEKLISGDDLEGANAFIEEHISEAEYMIQEALPLISFQNRTIDFRVIVIKNGQGNWQVMGIFARHGQPGNILSNISPEVKLAEKTLEEALGLNRAEISQLVKKMTDIAIESVKALDKTGIHFANTGVDIALDQQNKIHIIEVQHCNPSHDIAHYAGYPDLYYQILKTNMLYAKRLAGF